MNPNHHPVNKHGSEAIGKKVLVRHPSEDGKFAWFQGHVREWKDDQHCIIFSSKADHVWANLESWEKDDTLLWVRTNFDQEELAKNMVGRRVLIKFPIHSKKKKQQWAWFLATICGSRVRAIRKNGQQIVEHLVTYEDGDDEEWLNLWQVIKGKKLQFLEENSTGVQDSDSKTNEMTSQEGDDAAGIARVAFP